MILPNMDRQDIWDQLVNRTSMRRFAPDQRAGILEIRPIESFVCPADTDATSNVELPALTYSANTGAWDRDEQRRFLCIARQRGRHDRQRHLPEPRRISHELAARKAAANADVENPRRREHDDHALRKHQ